MPEIDIYEQLPSLLRNPFAVAELKALRNAAARLANDANAILRMPPTLDSLQLNDREILWRRREYDVRRSLLRCIQTDQAFRHVLRTVLTKLPL